MTVSTTQVRVAYTGDGTSVNFPIPFPFYLATDLLVLLAGVSISTGYSISGGGGTLGTLTMASAPSPGVNLQVVLNAPLTQIVNLVDGTAFPSVTLDQINDRAVQISQRLQDQVNRCIRAPDGDGSPLMLLPSAALRVSSALMLDKNGNIALGIPNTQVITTDLLAPFLNLQQTSAELVAGIIPVNFAYRPGSLLRYGADPTGVADSSAAFANAIACNAEVFDDYPGGGAYLINVTTAIKSVLRLHGQQKNVGGSATSGTTIIIGSALGFNNPCFHAATFISDFEADHLSFIWQDTSLGQIPFLCDVDVRSSRFHDMTFIGAAAIGTNMTCIKLAGGGTFSGDVTIDKNYADNVQTFAYLGSTCSTVRVLNNELYCNPAIPNSYGVNNQSNVGGVVVEGNTFEAWVKGVYAPNGNTRLLKNYFEGCTTFDFDFGTSGGNSAIEDFCTGAPLANFIFTNASRNLIWSGSYGYFADSSTLNAFRGFIEQNRAVANGHQITRAFAAGNYQASGSMSWTVTSGEVGADMLIVNGNEATYYFEITNSAVGGSPATALLINLATFGFTPSNDSFEACSITDNGGTPAMGMARAIANSQTLQIYKDATFATNWSTSTASTTVRGHIKFPIAFAVN